MPSGTRLIRSPLVLMTVATFVEFSCWKLMAPLLPLWASDLGAKPVMVGVLLTAFSAAELSCTPVLGALSDRLGRKPIVVASLGVAAVSFAMIAVAKSVPVLLAAEIVGGFGTAIVSVGQAAVADWVRPERLAHAMACIAGAIGLANAVGPGLAGALAGFGATVPFWAATALATANMGMIWLLLPETHRRGRGTVRARPVPFRELLRPNWIRRLALTTVIFGSILVTLEAVLPLFTRDTLGWGATANGWLFAYLGVAVAAMQLGVVGRFATRFGERRLLIAGLAGAAAGMVTIGTGTTVTSVLVGVGLIGIGAGLVIPLLPTLFCLASPVQNRGSILGLAQGLIATSRLVIPLVATETFTWSVETPFLIVAVLCLLGAGLLAVGAAPTAGGAGSGAAAAEADSGAGARR